MEEEGELIEKIRDVLRRNGDWNVSISLWAEYGCFRVTVTYLNTAKYTDIGQTLAKRLRNAVIYLQLQGVE